MAEAETKQEMLDRHAAEIAALDFDADKVARNKAAAEAKIATMPKVSADVTIADEVLDSEYVTIVYPTNKTGAEGALWVQIIASIEANTNIKTSKIRDPGTIRVRSDHYEQVFDAIEAALPLQEDV